MNSIRRYINDQLDETDVPGCMTHMDIFHRKIQQIAVRLFINEQENDDTEVVISSFIIDSEVRRNVLNFLTYTPYDIEESRYLDEVDIPDNQIAIANIYIKAAIAEFTTEETV